MPRGGRGHLTLSAGMLGVGLVALGLAFCRAVDAPPRTQATIGVLIAFQYLALFVIVFVLGPRRPED